MVRVDNMQQVSIIMAIIIHLGLTRTAMKLIGLSKEHTWSHVKANSNFLVRDANPRSWDSCPTVE